jgi:prepilin-type N-terminal cleavage/methylation domain-containing protein
VTEPSSSIKSEDKGFTLIELLVYLSLATIILFIVGGFMISSLRIERDVTSSATGVDAAQLVSTSVLSGVRNGSAARVETAINGDQMLVVLTIPVGGSMDPICQAWFYSAADKSVYTKKSSIPAAAIAWPTTGVSGNWALLGSGIAPRDSATRVFKPAVDATAIARGIGPKSDFVSLTFEGASSSNAPVRIESTSHTRVDMLAGAPCFA